MTLAVTMVMLAIRTVALAKTIATSTINSNVNYNNSNISYKMVMLAIMTATLAVSVVTSDITIIV